MSPTAALTRYTTLRSHSGGWYRTEIEALHVFRADRPSGLIHEVYDVPEPAVCVVLQGAKQAAVGDAVFTYEPGGYFAVGVGVPIAGRVTRASPEAPYLAVHVRLDVDLLLEVAQDAGVPAGRTDGTTGLGAVVAPLGGRAAEALGRLVGLLETPEAARALYPAVTRELYYWLFAGPGGDQFHRIVFPSGYAGQVAAAVRQMRTAFPSPVRVTGLAEAVGMSVSSFYVHFKALTGMAPLQYYKQLRLLEARRLLTTEGASASGAASAVGYESPSQFGREYRRLFSTSPARDVARRNGHPVMPEARTASSRGLDEPVGVWRDSSRPRRSPRRPRVKS